MILNPVVGGGGSVALEWHELMTVSTYAPPVVTMVQGIIPIDPDNMPRYIIVQSDTYNWEAGQVPTMLIFNQEDPNAPIPSVSGPGTGRGYFIGTTTFIGGTLHADGENIVVEVANDFQWKYAFIY